MEKDESASQSDLTRLRFSKDFRKVLATGCRIRSGGVVVVRKEGRPGPPRVGLVVPRLGGTAVRRNRIRRRLRHAVREIQLESDMDYVIIAQPSVAEVGFAVLVEWLSRAVGKSS